MLFEFSTSSEKGSCQLCSRHELKSPPFATDHKLVVIVADGRTFRMCVECVREIASHIRV